MSQVAQSYARWLADFYLLTTVFLALALAGMAVLKQPAQRLAIAKSTLISLILLAVLCAIPGWSALHLLTAETPRPVAELLPAVTSAPIVVAERPRPVVTEAPVVAPGPEIQSANIAPPAAPEPLHISWPALLAATHSLGAACIIVWLALGWLASTRLRQTARPAPPDLLTVLKNVFEQDHASANRPQLLTHTRIDVAAALGVWRPTILLPEKWTKSESREQLQTVLAHESVHVLNHDLKWVALARCLFVALWANPLFWVVRRCLRLDQEALADAAAAEVTSRQQYAEQLVAWARDVSGRPSLRLSSAVGLWEGPSQLRQRIALLLNERLTVLRNCSRRWRLASYGLCAVAALALSLVTIAAVPDDADQAVVPQTTIFQHGVERLGVLPKAIFTERPEVKWKYGPKALGAGIDLPSLGDVAADDGAVYSSDSTGRLFALEANTGAETWVYQTTANVQAQAPFIRDQTIYYACGVGVVTLNRQSGNLLWEYKIPDGGEAECSPIVVKDKLYVTGYDGVMRALNANTGELIWERELLSDAPDIARGEVGDRARFGKIKARPRIPASDGKTIYQPIFDQMRLVAVDAETGKTRWSFKTGDWIFCNPVVHDSRVYIGSQDQFMYCLDSKTGAEIWKFKTSSRIEAGAALCDGRVYFGCCAGLVYCADATTGKELWKFSVGKSAFYCPPLVTRDGALYLGAMAGEIYCLDAASGKLRWKIRPSEKSEIDSNLATDGTRLFVGTRPTRAKTGEVAIAALESIPVSGNKNGETPRPVNSDKQKGALRSGPPRRESNTASGRAIDEKGQPVVGAEVFLFRVNQYDGKREFLGQKSTDADGQFRFDNVIDIEREFPGRKFPSSNEPGDEMLQGVVRAPGRVSQFWLMMTQLVAQAGDYQQVQMFPSASLRGTVTDANGKPVAGALVSIGTGNFQRWEGANASHTDAQGKYKIDDLAPYNSAELEKQIAEQKRQLKEQEANGSRLWTSYLSQPVLTIEHPDYAVKHASFEKAPGTKDVQLDPAASLEGHVVFADSGKPAAGVLVGAGTSVADRGPPTTELLREIVKVAVRTDANGKYRLANLPAGKYDLWAETPDWVNEGLNDVVATPGKTGSVFDLKFTKGGVVSARLVDAKTREPIAMQPAARAYFLIRPVSERPTPRPLPAPFITVNDEGRFELNLTPGKNMMGAGGVEIGGTFKYSGPPTTEVTVLDGQTVRVDFPVTEFPVAKPNGGASAAPPKVAAKTAQASPATPKKSPPQLQPNVIRGRVLDEKGQPIAGAEAFLFRINRVDSSRKLQSKTATDADGRYRFENVIDIAKEFPDGTLLPLNMQDAEFVQVFAKAPDRVAEMRVELRQEIARLGKVFEMKLSPAATLSGRVTGPDGKPVAGALVSVGLGGVVRWEGSAAARTDPDGKYVIKDAEPFDIVTYRKWQDEQRWQMKAPGQNSVFLAPPVLVVEHPDFATRQTSYEKIPGTQDVQLEPAAIVEGRVVYGDSSKPATGAVVHVTTARPGNTLPTSDELYTLHNVDIRADADGKYRITTLPAGSYDLSAEMSDWVNVSIEGFAASAGKTTAAPNLILTKGGPISIRLIDAKTDKPLELQPEMTTSISAFRLPLTGIAQPVWTPNAKANPGGRFELRCPPGKRAVYVLGVTIGGKMKWMGKISPGQTQDNVVSVAEGEPIPIDIAVVDVKQDDVSGTYGAFATNGTFQITSAEKRELQDDIKTQSAILDKDPKNFEALLERADSLALLGDDRKALADFERVMQLDLPVLKSIIACNTFARFLATSADDGVRDGKRAVKLAEKAQQLQKTPATELLDTLAAAYAEAGDFDRAVKTQQQAIQMATQERRAKFFRDPLKLYEAHKPRRETRATNDQPADKKDGANASVPEAPKDAATKPPAQLSTVVAKNVLLLDGKEIISWDDVDRKIAALPDPSKLQPNFYYTNGAIESGAEKVAKTHIWDLSRKFKLNGHSEGTLLPRTSLRYDNIRTKADLIPDESLRVEGTVIGRDNKPVAGAEVILITPVAESLPYKAYNITLVEGRIRNRLDELVTDTDAAGRFVIYPPKGQKYYVLALHPAVGINIARSQEFAESHKVQLLAWATLTSELGPEPGANQSASISTRLEEKDGYPEVTVDQYWSDLKREKPTNVFVFTHVPPIFTASISRDFAEPDGGSMGLSAASVSLLPGESRRIDLGPLSDAQREWLKSLLDESKKRSESLQQK